MKVLSLLLVTAFLLGQALSAQARPCTASEAQVNEMLDPGSECWQPDHHPLPYGIAVPPPTERNKDHVYFLNLTGKTLEVLQAEAVDDSDENAGEEVFSRIRTLPAGSYGIADTDGMPTYAFKTGKQSQNFLLEPRIRAGNTGDRRAFYYFIAVTQQGGKLAVREIPEQQAVERLRSMKFLRTPL